jgi:ubiquinone/menaquinone biosynthesis C-methylase UbiE
MLERPAPLDQHGADTPTRRQEDEVTDAPGVAPGDRAYWERRWDSTSDEDFEWSLPGVAPQLRELVDGGSVPAGRGLDLGCGAGVSTNFLAARFAPSVGVDIALGAIRQARTGRSEAAAEFAVADAIRLPFSAAAFSIVFDRGCLQNLEKADWPRYFAEVDRVLASGGVLQLLVSKAVAQFPSILSTRGLKARWGWYVKKRRGGPQFLTHAFLRTVSPTSFRAEKIEDLPFTTKKGKGRQFTHAVFRKT